MIEHDFLWFKLVGANWPRGETTGCLINEWNSMWYCWDLYNQTYLFGRFVHLSGQLVSPSGHVSSRWISKFATVVLRWHLSQKTTLKMHSSACLSWSFLFTLVLHWPFSHLISSSGHLWFARCSILPSNWQRSHFASKFSTSFLTVKLVFSSLDIGVRQLGQCFAAPWFCTRTRQSLQYVWPHSGIIAGKIMSWWLQT